MNDSRPPRKLYSILRLPRAPDVALCPTGWKQAPATQGRFIVGAPKGAPPDVSFGGEPVSSATPRTHVHGNDVAVETVPHGIALAAGCCGSGYAKNMAYSGSAVMESMAMGGTEPWFNRFGKTVQAIERADR